MEYETGKIVVGFLNGNDIGAIGNLHPLLVVDCWEHSYVRDFGINGRREYVTKYATEIDWRMVWERREEGEGGEKWEREEEKEKEVKWKNLIWNNKENK